MQMRRATGFRLFREIFPPLFLYKLTLLQLRIFSPRSVLSSSPALQLQRPQTYQ